MKCPKCGIKTSKKDDFCPECGKSLVSKEEEEKGISMLALFVWFIIFLLYIKYEIRLVL